MSRTEFMRRLEELLSDISQNEREEALNFYEDYFDDAGTENEQKVMESLGSPEKVAKIIKEGIGDGSEEQGAFTENGFETFENDPKEELAGYEGRKKKSVFDKFKQMGRSGWILTLILAVFVWPFIGSIVTAVGSVFLGLLVAVFVLIFGLAVAGIGVIAAGGVLFASVIGLLILNPAHALLGAGISLVLIGIGVLLLVGGIWVVSKLLPILIRWITEGVSKIWRKNEV